MNYNNMDEMDMDVNLHNGDMSSGIGLSNIHTLIQFNKSSNLDNINIGA